MDRDSAIEIAAGFEEDLARRLDFIYELDRLKTVLRQSVLIDDSRQENSAEHSWHCLLYTSPSPRDVEESRMPSSA